MTCRHKYIRTWVFEDTKQPSGLWSCVDCSLKFEPITSQRQWVGLTDEEVDALWEFMKDALCLDHKTWTQAIEAKLKEKNA